MDIRLNIRMERSLHYGWVYTGIEGAVGDE